MFECYQDYIDSPMRKGKREQMLIRDGFKCRRCNSTNHLCVHHGQYTTEWGTEPQHTLFTLCNECHTEYHNIYGKKPNMETTISFIGDGNSINNKSSTMSLRYRQCWMSGGNPISKKLPPMSFKLENQTMGQLIELMESLGFKEQTGYKNGFNMKNEKGFHIVSSASSNMPDHVIYFISTGHNQSVMGTTNLLRLSRLMQIEKCFRDNLREGAISINEPRAIQKLLDVEMTTT